MQACPCGTQKNLQDCCGAFLSGLKIPITPEELMRSRYTAYSQANIDYIIKTMKSPAADGFDRHSAKEWAVHVKWGKLEVLNTHYDDTRGWVEFVVNYQMNNKNHVMHEVSEFRRDDGMWFYIDGVTK